MKTRTIALTLIAAAAASPAVAASPFDGTWKTDLKTVKFDPKPDAYLLAGGVYTCKTCIPAITVPADGQFHAVTGHDYFDAYAVKIDDAHAITTMSKRSGKLISTTKRTVSPDGKTLTYANTSVSDTGVKTVGTSTATRVAAAPTGAHAVSGSWKPAAVQQASAAGIELTTRLADGIFTLTAPTGETYTAKLGGPAVLERNDPAKTMIRVKQVAPDRIVEEDMIHGKLVAIVDMTVAPGGKSMMVASTDKRDDTTSTFTMLKE